MRANDVLRFLLELAALAALAYWGFTVGTGPTAWALGLGAPLVAAVFWGALVAPKARIRAGRTGRALLGLVVFGAAALALADTGHDGLALALAALALANAIVMIARP